MQISFYRCGIADAGEYVQPMPVRMIRNVMNRFWGGSTAAADDTSEDEAHEAHELPIHEDGGD